MNMNCNSIHRISVGQLANMTKNEVYKLAMAQTPSFGKELIELASKSRHIKAVYSL